ncbi:Abcf3 [Symbiodinium pilosum]|uniref:Abcf3 protein n=1 Tax=Symbiodinium pilosum TaxID=2952 RepID=A0A812LVA1_SYMPI|nr:Abcf3 [Symbiodinium pilosum]
MAEAPNDRVLTETVRAPHNAVKAEKLSVYLGSRCLLTNTELKIAERPKHGTCYGLVGCNGSGKSTLLRLMAERKLPVPETWDVFLLGQHIPPAEDQSAIEEVLSVCPRRSALLAEAERLHGILEAGPEPGLLEQLQKVHADLAECQSARSEVLHIMQNLGFRAEAQASATPAVSTPLPQLSGGWRMKVELAKALWLRPKLLLLDEPTNHLDFHARSWLMQQLADYPRTVVVVSHDVEFLHEVCKDIIWMTEQRLEALPGKVVSQEDLLRMQRRRPLRFEFRVPAGEDPVSHGISLHNVDFTYGDGTGLFVESLRLSGCSRAVLLGQNGGGKSTFLKLCAGHLQPGRGAVDRTPGLRVGHFSQLSQDLDAMSDLTAAEFLLQQCGEELAQHAGSTHTSRLRAAVNQAPEAAANGPRAAKSKVSEKRLLEVARGVLSNYGLEGDVATKVPVDCLSGGQKACLKPLGSFASDASASTPHTDMTWQ